MEINLNGFHGTLKSSAYSIKKDGFKINEYDKSGQVPSDLGSGVYFYVEDELKRFGDPMILAKKYAINNKGQGSDKNICVIESKIIFDNSVLLDLDEEINSSMFTYYRSSMEEAIIEKFKELNPKIKKHGNMDGWVLNKMIKSGIFSTDPKVVIKETFTPLRSGMTSNFPNGREISVRDLSLIIINNSLGDMDYVE